MGKRRNIIDAMFKLRLFDAVYLRPQLTVLTYHRIGEAQSEFDHSVFGPTADAFAQQMKWLAAHSDPVSETDLLAALDGKITLPRRSVLVTFDDAYKDQYTIGAPILKTYGIPAIFFVSPGMIDNQSVGFWDQIAYAVKQSRELTLTVRGHSFDLTDKQSAIRSITGWVKTQPGSDTFRLTELISRKLQVDPASRETQATELMTWQEIHELAQDRDRHGLSIGSHGQTHRLLAQLSTAEQEAELRDSKNRLEESLGIAISSLAYPAGSFSTDTPKIAMALGYRAVFSFETGFNSRTNLDAADIRRIPAGDTPSLIACATSIPWALGASFYP